MKKFLLSLAFSLVHGVSIAARRLAEILRKAGSPLHTTLRVIFPFFLWVYGLFVKMRILYGTQRKAAGHLLATPFGYYGLRVCMAFIIGGLVISSQFFGRADDQDFFKPSPIVARFVLPLEETSVTLPDSAQEDLSQSPDSLPDKDAITSEDAVPEAPFTGELALNPDALLKPILPTGETLAPTPETIKTYTVRQGDTISTIAARFGLKASTILWANDLSETSIIRQGQSLTIPPVDGIIYTVRKGDTLARIAQIFNTETDKIIQINHLANADSLSIGQTLILPGARQYIPSVPRQQTLIARLRNLIIPKPKGAGAGAIAAVARFLWPTSARRITQYFGWRHTGVDIAGPTSNRIYAAASGKVVIAGWQRGYGLTILIDHGNGYTTRYAHARILYVSSGEQVQKGDTIAMVGSTGRSTGPHVHFEVVLNGRRVNPLSYIR